MMSKLKQLQKKYPEVTEVRGLGLMIGMELNSADLAKAVVQQMLARKVILNRTDETVVRFLPPFIIGEKHVDVVVRGLESVLANLTKPAGAAAGQEK
jgi:acetylornithine aminotransferase/acetylornithine/N-succinyldiaminopimelate aminotransferase